MEPLTKALRALFHADTLIATIWLNLAMRQASLAALATLVAVFGLIMLNFAAYLTLDRHIGSVEAALVISAVDILLAAILVVIATHTKPSRELKLAQELRENALDQLASIASHPLDLASQALIAPLLTSLVKGFREKS